MRTLKKTLCLVLCLAMMAGLCVFATADFKDQDEVKNTEAVSVLTTIGVITGDDKGNFNPNGTLTRAEACTIIARMLDGDDLEATCDFTDVHGKHWGESYIAFCVAEGVVKGYGDGTFGPDDKLTGSQWAAMLLRTLGFEITGESWEIDVAKLVKSEELAKGIKFVGGTAITRDDACQTAFNAMKWSEKAAVDGYYFDVTGYEGIVFASRSEAMTFAALVDKTVLTVDKLKEHKNTEGSLLGDSFKTKEATEYDAFGRKTSGWTVDKSITGTDKDVFVAVSTEKAAYNVVISKDYTVGTAEQLAAALNTELGLKNKAALTVTEGIMLNGADAAYADLKVGDEVEVYLAGTSKTTVAKVIVTRYAFEQVGTVATKLTADEKETGATSKITLGSDKILDVNFVDFDYATGDYILAVVVSETVGSATVKKVIASKPAETVTGEVDAIKAGTYRIDGSYYASTLTGSDALAIGSAGTYALNNAGVITAVVKADNTVTHEYAYIYNVVDATPAGSIDDDGFSTSAKKVYNAYYALANGTKGMTPLAVDKDGKVLSGTDVPSNLNDLCGLYDYTIVDGKLNGKSVAKTDTLQLAKETNKIGDKYMTSSTKYVFINKTANKVDVVMKTGYANAAAAASGDVYVIADAKTKIASTVFVLGTPAGASASSAKYAFLLDTDAVVTKDSDGNTYNTYSVMIDGEETTLTGKGTTINGVGKGGYFEYTLTGEYLTGNVTGVATPAGSSVTFVTIVENSIDISGMKPLAEGVTVYNVDATTKAVTVIETTDLTAGDTFDYFTNAKGEVAVIIRTALAPDA